MLKLQQFKIRKKNNLSANIKYYSLERESHRSTFVGLRTTLRSEAQVSLRPQESLQAPHPNTKFIIENFENKFIMT